MVNSYAKAKGRRGHGYYITFPVSCLQHHNFKNLSAKACKMLFELGSQFKGYNNGDLQATWKLLAPNGWSSKDTIQKSLEELERSGWIIKTRQGGLNRCSLYAITFHPIFGNAKFDIPWDSHGKKYPAPNCWRTAPDDD